MAKYIYLYRGPATPMDTFTPEQGAEQMALWGAWMGKVGTSLVDGGAPFGPGTAVKDDGSEGDTTDVNGYTIVEADDLAGAKALTSGHPFLSDGSGKFAIEIFELLPM